MLRYGALHTPTLQETSSRIYGHHNHKGKFWWTIFMSSYYKTLSSPIPWWRCQYNIILLILSQGMYCHITYYMLCMQLVLFHHASSNIFYPQVLNILAYFAIILYITIHRKTLSPILHFMRSKMSYYDSFIVSYLHRLFSKKHHIPILFNVVTSHFPWSLLSISFSSSHKY